MWRIDRYYRSSGPGIVRGAALPGGVGGTGGDRVSRPGVQLRVTTEEAPGASVSSITLTMTTLTETLRVAGVPVGEVGLLHTVPVPDAVQHRFVQALTVSTQ